MKTKLNPLVSILIANYNNENYLTKCLDSVLNQKYKKIEIIVVDDYSNDNSLNILKKYKNSITIIKNKKKTKFGSFNQINAYQLGFKKSILVCGLSYKTNVEDMRDSASFKIINELTNLGFEVFGYDPFFKEEIIEKRSIF